MIIHNGDHAEFEREHANTPPKERPDWPLPSFDARDWAEAFCKRFPTVSEDNALGWFANALMRGYDEARSREQAVRNEALEECAELVESAQVIVANTDLRPRPVQQTLAHAIRSLITETKE